MKEIVVFSLSSALYGIDIQKIKGIIVYSQLLITPLFNEKEFVIGIANIRGEVIPVIDLRKKFNYEVKYDEETVVLIIYTNEGKWIGIVVDFIRRIEEINPEFIKQPQLIKGIDKKYLEGLIKIDDDMITILNIDLLLNIKELEDEK